MCISVYFNQGKMDVDLKLFTVPIKMTLYWPTIGQLEGTLA